MHDVWTRKKTWGFEYLLCALALIIIAFTFIHVKNINIHIPLAYNGDGLFTQAFVKTMIDTGWYITNPYIGFQNGYNLSDFPMSDTANIAIIWLLIHSISHNAAVVTNSFYFLTFFMAAFSCLFVLRYFGLKYPFALAASLLYTFLPYHFLHGEGHLFLCSYYSVPIWSMIALSIILERPIHLLKNKNLNTVLKLIVLSIISASGVYYTFFACIFIFSAGVIATLSQNNDKALWRSASIIGFAILIVLINIMPSLIYQMTQGNNFGALTRSIGDTERYGLTITQLILPVEGHRLQAFNHLREFYNRWVQGNQDIESQYSSQGIVASLGFFILLITLFCQEKIKDQLILQALMKFNLIALLWGTVGGFSSLFALLVTSEFRSWDRICVYVSFFSLFAFFYCLQQFFEKKQLAQNHYWGAALIVLVIGLFDQVGCMSEAPKTPMFESQFQSDKAFVANIEQQVPANSAIFELPYIDFPEGAVLNPIAGNYTLFRPYLHSNNLSWSFGASKGRSVALWQQKVAALPAPKMLKELRLAGYSGIYIDRGSYEDQGKKIELQLSQALNEKPLVSQDQSASFFVLKK